MLRCFIARTVLFTKAFGLHQLTNPFVFQYKPNPEGRYLRRSVTSSNYGDDERLTRTKVV